MSDTKRDIDIRSYAAGRDHATRPRDEQIARLTRELDDAIGALWDATTALEGFDGISIKGTKLHWSRADRQALRRAQKVVAKYVKANTEKETGS